MIYLSKGMVCKGSTEDFLEIIHHGKSFNLDGMLAVLWLNGQYGFAVTESEKLHQLILMGLAEGEDTDTLLSRYRIMTRCILCHARVHKLHLLPEGTTEKKIWIWLKFAGIRLTTAELIYLIEKHVEPAETLLYEENRQALVERIYTTDTIGDRILESQMEAAEVRDKVIATLLRMIRKKRIIIL